MENFEMNVTLGEGMRRFPVYLLLDCSSSMTGSHIEAVRRGVEQFVQEARAEVFSRDTLHVGIITFDSGARMVTPGLVPIAEFQPPSIVASGSTNLGQALRVLQQSLDNDVKPTIKGQAKGDYKPLVFILTDGAPDDGWQTPRQELIDRQTARVVNVITVGCGTGVNAAMLKQIAVGPSFLMDDQDASFKAFFQWVTQTVQSVTRSFQSGEDKPVDMPPANPQVFQYIP